jgi:D-lactate dehydrogenase
MKLIFFSCQDFEKNIFQNVLKQKPFDQIEMAFQKEHLHSDTAVLAEGYDGVVAFVNDQLDKTCLEKLKALGLQVILLRSAGFNHVDIQAAQHLQIPVYRVPAYSPEAVAEHAVALLLSLNRKIYKAYNRVREMNFSLEGLVGFTLSGKKIGVIGAGKIGQHFAKIMSGFGCQILLYDPFEDEAFANRIGACYVRLETLLADSDVISVHCPLSEKTKYLINRDNISLLKKNVILINTSRGAVIETRSLIHGLKKGQIGGAALDVYEFESELFFADHSAEVIQDDIIARLLTFPNVLITSHQGFLTEEALHEIALVTLQNALDFQKNGLKTKSINRILLED